MDTRVGNGVLNSYLFPEQPNLEDEISLGGEVCNSLVFGPFLFLLIYLVFALVLFSNTFQVSFAIFKTFIEFSMHFVDINKSQPECNSLDFGPFLFLLI